MGWRERKMEDLSGLGVGMEITLVGKPHSHVPPHALRVLRLDFLLRALIRRGCEQSHVGFVCF